MGFALYDSALGRQVELVPLVPGQVSVYCCGLTVQGPPHLGHFRAFVVFDLLSRWLRFSGLKVNLVRNITDIDDKILAKSAEAGDEWYAHAYRYELTVGDAQRALGCLPLTYEPRATGHITEMHELIATLIERGHAYPTQDGSGDVYFDVGSWAAHYGELSGQKLDEMEPDADADPRGKRDPRDFALWKGSKPTEPATASWPSPWGRGRPGWHIECSAMSGKYLGDSFDIHGGGMDLKFPHHENERAQSQAAGRGFAHHWMHVAFLTDPSGEKMSKSLGNTMQVSEIIQRYPPRAVRLYLAGSHYRSMVEFSDQALAEAGAALNRIDSFVSRAGELVGTLGPGEEVPAGFRQALDDDLGAPAALAVLHETVRQGNKALDAGDPAAAAQALVAVQTMLSVFGLWLDDPVWADTGGDDLVPVVDTLVAALLDQRQQARARKDYAAADAIRDQLTAAGLVIEDTPSGPRWTRP